MFCPECGEVIGSGPLDARRARYSCDGGVTKAIDRWLRGLFRRSRLREG